MAGRKKAPRSENLSIRLDPKTKFILDFVSRIRGQTITTVVERAILETAGRVTVSSAMTNVNRDEDNRTWEQFWDYSEGTRFLKLAIEPDIPKTFEEDEILAFMEEHAQFFSVRENLKHPTRAMVDALWPKIDDYVQLWREHRTSDAWIAGKAMAKALSAAGIKPPDWPPEDEKKTRNDDIPF